MAAASPAHGLGVGSLTMGGYQRESRSDERYKSVTPLNIVLHVLSQ